MPRVDKRYSFKSYSNFVAGVRKIPSSAEDKQYHTLWTRLDNVGVTRPKTTSAYRFRWWQGRIILFLSLSSDERRRYCQDFMSMLLSEGNDEESMYLLPCVVLYADSLHTHSFSLQLHENWFSWRFGNHPISLATEMDEEMKDIKAENFLSELGYWNAPTVLHLPSTFPEVPLPRITVTAAEDNSYGHSQSHSHSHGHSNSHSRGHHHSHNHHRSSHHRDSHSHGH